MNNNKIVLLLLILCIGVFTTSCTSNNKINSIDLPSRGMCAHRGAMDTHPENTIPAFVAAVDAGAHMIELDLWLTKDNQMVVIHDRTVDRTTDGTGRVVDLTFDEIRKLDAGKWMGDEFEGLSIPTFEEALSVLPYNVWINVHVKGTGELPIMAAQMIEQKDRLHQAFLACSLEAADEVKEVVPEVMICNMDRVGTPSDYVNKTIEYGADFIQLITVDYPEIERDIKLLKENGVKINYFGTDDAELLEKLLSLGVEFPLVNNIFTAQVVAEKLDIAPVLPIFDKIRNYKNL